MSEITTGHTHIVKESGCSFSERPDLYLKHEKLVSTTVHSPINIVLKKSPYRDENLMMMQNTIKKVIIDNNFEDYHANLTTKAYHCENVGLEDCPDGWSTLKIDK